MSIDTGAEFASIAEDMRDMSIESIGEACEYGCFHMVLEDGEKRIDSKECDFFETNTAGNDAADGVDGVDADDDVDDAEV